jgi:16S rRNA (cytosine967-C5)-methyltransferase
MDTPAVLREIAMHELDMPEASHVQLWPHRHGTDAMFIQLLVKADS